LISELVTGSPRSRQVGFAPVSWIWFLVAQVLPTQGVWTSPVRRGDPRWDHGRDPAWPEQAGLTSAFRESLARRVDGVRFGGAGNAPALRPEPHSRGGQQHQEGAWQHRLAVIGASVDGDFTGEKGSD